MDKGGMEVDKVDERRPITNDQPTKISEFSAFSLASFFGKTAIFF